MGRRWPYFFFLFFDREQNRDRELEALGSQPLAGPVCGHDHLGDPISIWGDGVEKPAVRPSAKVPALPSASGLSSHALWAGLRAWAQTGSGDLPRLPNSAPPGMAGPLGYSFASPRARSRTLPSDSLVLSLQVTEAPREQVATAGGGGRSEKGVSCFLATGRCHRRDRARCIRGFS